MRSLPFLLGSFAALCVGSVRPCAAALAPIRLFPANAATTVCPDTPLRLTFSTVPAVGASNVKIHDAATHDVVETIALATPVATKIIGGLEGYNYYTALADGNDVTFFPRPGALAYGKSYYVTVDAGAVTSGAESTAAIEQPDAWHFSTQSAPPPIGSAMLTVAADGSGDFCTVQGALDFIPDGNTTPTTIFVRKGTYAEIIFFTNKHAITLRGEDRQQTVIAYANNAKFNASGGNPFANRANPSGENPKRGGSVYRRGLFLAHRVEDFTLTHLTLRNTTPHGGSQAEALILNGTTEARAIIRDVDFYSFQDTVQINGQAFITGCHIEGDVDFMWGTGPSFFADCTFRSLRPGAYYTQVRNPATNHGFVYHRCTFDGAPGVVENYLSRIEPHRFPHSEVVLLDCVLGPSVHPVGWQLQSAPKNSPPASAADLHFWEFNNHTADGQPANVTDRLAASRQLKLPADALLIDDYRNPAFVLGHDWNPARTPAAK